MNWSFQYRIASNGDEDSTWRNSARPYEKVEDAAAGTAHCQSVLAVHGVILETRLMPYHPKHVVGDAAAEKLLDAVTTPEVSHPIGFAPRYDNS